MVPKQHWVQWTTRLAWASLLMVYLVICAGSTVRASGAGMGCPDWPKCYGYLIPPTEAAQVAWSPNREYRHGQMIIHSWQGNERLLVAQSTFTTSTQFNATNWHPYERHDYAIFNATHTWTEFINRLLGATTGLPVLAMLVASVWAAAAGGSRWRVVGTVSTLGILGFVAWLGKVVVDGNLIPGQITMHMFGAVALIALLVAIILADGRQRAAVPARLWWVGLGLVLCLGVQTYLGTQVREHVDYMNKAGLPRAEWVANFGGIFLAHRSLSWLVTAVAAWWWWQQRQSGTASAPRFAAHGAAVLVLAQVATGVVLAYAGMPALAQPLHLVLSMLLFGCWWYWLLSTRAAANAAAAHGV